VGKVAAFQIDSWFADEIKQLSVPASVRTIGLANFAGLGVFWKLRFAAAFAKVGVVGVTALLEGSLASCIATSWLLGTETTAGCCFPWNLTSALKLTACKPESIRRPVRFDLKRFMVHAESKGSTKRSSNRPDPDSG